MIRKLRTPAVLALALALAGASYGAEEPPVPAGPALTPEELSGAVKIDALTIPTPGEVLAAIDKLGKPDWASAIRPPISTNYSSRAQMAINIGGLVADGYIAVEAASPQQVKNIGRDIVTLARPLGVGQDIINRGKSLVEFADDGRWDTLKEEFEATQNEVKTSMRENKDSELITLVTLGGWIRATQAMANYVAAHYTEDAAKLLRQPGIVHFLNERLAALPEKVRDDNAVRKARAGLATMEKAISFPAATPPSKEAVQNLDDLATKLLKDLAVKKQ
ncbi:MAG TPA: hypothetical protein VGO11_09290 [Chthoniobacteraceae bacterium]|jgi:hypothetical protein|nr:hypothetical protein [Chthoniobacteraceae bacterium]